MRWDEDERLLLEDVIHALALPALVVSDAGLGTINHTVLTVEYARARDIPIRGILLNRYVDSEMPRDNRRMIEALTGVKVVDKYVNMLIEDEARIKEVLDALYIARSSYNNGTIITSSELYTELYDESGQIIDSGDDFIKGRIPDFVMEEYGFK